jgi:putative ABC transport system permease protein
VPGRVPDPLVSSADLDRLGADRGIHSVWLRAQDQVEAGAYQASVQRAGAQVVGLQLSGGLLDRAMIAQLMQVLLWIATGLLAVALLISLVGVGNTLALSVLERGRESGVQRALGMTRRQLRGSLALEALLLAGVGSATAVALGTVLGYAGAVTLVQGVADQVWLVVPWADLAMLVTGVSLAAVLASVLPARRASRVPPTVALAAD